MIQKGTYFNVMDNSGGKKACCIHICGGYRKRYSRIGDVVVVSIKSIRKKRKELFNLKKETSKLKKGDVLKGLVIRTKSYKPSYSNEVISFLDNSIVLLNNQNKLIGTRVFGPILRQFRYTKYLRLVSISSGLLK